MNYSEPAMTILLDEMTSDTIGTPCNGASEARANEHVRSFVHRAIDLCVPDEVYWCDGSDAERHRLISDAVREGVLIELNQEKLPGCYLHRSNPNDVARSEQCTFICAPAKDDAGSTNNWMEPKVAYATLTALFDRCMRGRTMYVIPFVMGP